MKITLAKLGKTVLEQDLLVIGAFKAGTEGKKTKGSTFQEDKTIKGLDSQMGGHLITQALHEGFNGDEAQSYVTGTLGQTKAKSIALLGLGHIAEQNMDLFRRFAGEAMKLAVKKRSKKIGILVSESTVVPLFDVIQAITEGIRLSCYRFDHYLSNDKTEIFVKEIQIQISEEPSATLKSAIARGEHIAEAVCLARDLINEGPCVVNPEKLAETAQKWQKKPGY